MNPWGKKRYFQTGQVHENESSEKKNNIHLNKQLHNSVGENRLLNREAAALY